MTAWQVPWHAATGVSSFGRPFSRSFERRPRLAGWPELDELPSDEPPRLKGPDPPPDFRPRPLKKLSSATTVRRVRPLESTVPCEMALAAAARARNVAASFIV